MNKSEFLAKAKRFYIKCGEFGDKELEETKTFEYPEKKYKITIDKGSYVLDCDDKTFAKVCYGHYMLDKALKSGFIDKQDIYKIMKELL